MRQLMIRGLVLLAIVAAGASVQRPALAQSDALPKDQEKDKDKALDGLLESLDRPDTPSPAPSKPGKATSTKTGDGSKKERARAPGPGPPDGR